ncbi:DUF1684 domain-containing protein [Christiangramia forsetii]|uniref:DUF1684 domain-containing protein n=2 Tax=Christiangramia forsetii TaxID=411153 RepID=A0LYM9_CHRFK|nr:DUF1684 domain-containing protein [Christiangramia forsetii]GGG33792.1 hypothetical protein GCM10011532_16840 [Christiangramia forsetii]CAL65474.1 conserved hypothetical protein, secreted [Christiangramia forsetii KT0803]
MYRIKFSCFCLFIFLFSLNITEAQEIDLTASSKEFQKELNEEYANSEESPLEEKDLKNFSGLEFFEINPEYIVMAEFVRTPAESPFAMRTSTDRMPIYVKYGELYFTLKERGFKLNLYQNQELTQDPEYFDYLFLPITDLTNGISTYGGGRYIDFRIPESKEVILDFNKAYNPYCAYNGKYSCPIPPKENDLDIEILAGVKSFKNN